MDGYIKKTLWVGIGCQNGVSSRLIKMAIAQIFPKYQLLTPEICGIATIDTKASEPGLGEFCDLYNFPLKTFTAAELSYISVPHPAAIIQKILGTPSVAEAAAILAAGAFAPLDFTLVVPKQIFKLPGETGAMTLAVSQTIKPNFSYANGLKQ
jgi:cobalamin biosynthesis protein CbiG